MGLNGPCDEALSQLVNHVRREVLDALVARFRDTCSLFASRWLTQQAGVDFANLDEKTLDEVDWSETLGEGLFWVDQGMPYVERALRSPDYGDYRG
jgi:hypothetical protein